ncbi:hypothetical protein PAMP_009273 [Pampus punctatissimus]
MAATAAVRPPPPHPGLDGGNLHTRTSNSAPNSGQQDPGLHGTRQDPGQSSHPQHHVPVRPVFYVHAPPPPPFLHYQWPMPFSYNPFTGFPGMGYGMVIPPFPPPYMETPAYILPHSHIQPVDYRRLLHPQVHASNAPYHNPNQTRRIRQPHSFPVRETVNSEVQTEPLQRGGGSPPISLDSGHGAASSSLYSSHSSLQKQGSPSSSPSSSGSSLQKQGPSSNAKEDFQVNGTSSSIKHGFNIPHPTGMKTVQPCIRATVETQNRCKDGVSQDNLVSCRNAHCNMWSVSSTDSMTPVCNSSQQEDKVIKERRVSVPDILMSWGGGTPQAAILKIRQDGVRLQNEDLPSFQVEHEKCVYQSPTETKNSLVVTDAEGILGSKDSETIFKIVKLPFDQHELLTESRRENETVESVGSIRHSLPYNDELLYSLNISQKLPDHELENDNETNPHEDTTELIPYQMSLSNVQLKRNMNESAWSVESLAAFVPTKDWLMQNGTFESEVIVEMTEEAENGQLLPQNDNVIVKACKESRQSQRFSSTPAEKPSLPKKTEVESETDASDMTGLHSQNESQKLPDHEIENDSETNPHEDTTETTPYQMSLSSGQMKRNMNESVWSVESLAPFVPTKDWLMQNGMLEPEVIVEMTEEVENGQLLPQNDNLIVKACKERRQSQRFYSIFNTPAEKPSLPKKPEMESEIDASDVTGLSNRGQSVAPSEKDPLAFSSCLLSKNHLSIPAKEDKGENRSSEPEANQSPNQESHIVPEQQVKNPCSPKQEETLVSNSAAEKKILSTGHLILRNRMDMRAEDGVYGNEGQLRNKQLCAPMAHQKMVEVSLSKGHLVDCGIQCTELQELKCSCQELKTNVGPNGKHLFKYSDMKRVNNGKAEGFCINGHMQKNNKRHGQWRNKRQEKLCSQQEADNGYRGKPGKSKGGNGRNPQ